MRVVHRFCQFLRDTSITAVASRWGQGIVRDRRLSTGATPAEANDHFFRYTSGRWLYDEQLQLENRYVEFNIQALRHTAAHVLGSRCIEMSKVPEGFYNKVLSLKMEDGREVLARIPNPNAGNPKHIVASEVATLDFARNVLHIPAPKVLAWSSPSLPQNPIGPEYMLMEKVQGCQLSEVWDNMSEAQRFGLIKSLVNIERKLASTEFAAYGSLYYKDTHPHGRNIIDRDAAMDDEVISKFELGPTTERSFWEDEKKELDLDRGSWNSAQEYLSAVAKREIAIIRSPCSRKTKGNPISSRIISSRPDIHVQHLEQFLAVLAYILPPEELSRPVLLHHDLHAGNIFVDHADPTKISGIIDWQTAHTAPLFMQAKFPSIIECHDAYPWGAVQPSLPNDYDNLPESERTLASEQLDRVRLKKYYELASRKFNPLLVKAMDFMRRDEDPTTFIFHIVGRSSLDGPIPIKEILIQVYEKWDQIMRRNGLDIPCPISFSEDEIKATRQLVQTWAELYAEFDRLRLENTGKDG
ncbi:kinase-like protein [Aspergillus campestris IBT 28561]|uniref:Altered inheritance of mitochondria protein 9, mitochondrial n=1 Tax=Aspergillus campestris (strain IBT 28561) TaxID=1392248 RepID=A0A2I1D127_ASPC2|nr:kinase-like protein [Aspergillus campestris IBT 28561]PKY03575.1 kinase-like protein [Aspergillus campestris IBT 28561]